MTKGCQCEPVDSGVRLRRVRQSRSRVVMVRGQKLLIFGALLLFVGGNAVASGEERAWFKSCGVKCVSPVEESPDVGLKLKKKAVRLVAPTLSPKRRWPGTVLVQVSVNREGRVGCARILRGHPLFHCAVLDAAGEWEFAPMKVEGERVAYTGLLLIEFSGDGRVTFKK